jgi:hypothetical protein
VPRAELRLAVLVRAAWPVLWQAGCVLLAAGGLVRLGGAEAGERGWLFLVLAAGYAGGALIGFVVRQRRPQTGSPAASRYVPAKRRGRSAASVDALGRWTVGQAFAFLNPRVAVRVSVPVLLAIPGGPGLLAGTAMLLGWAAAVYAASLLHAIVRVAGEAAAWLESTPIAFAPFSRAVAARPLLHELAAAAALAAALIVLGTPWPSAVYLAAQVWSLVLVAACIAVSAAHRRRGRRAAMAAALVLLALAESLKHGTWLPAAGLLSIWHLHRGAGRA